MKLLVHGLSKSFGSVRAVQDVGFSCDAGSVTGYIGPWIRQVHNAEDDRGSCSTGCWARDDRWKAVGFAAQSGSERRIPAGSGCASPGPVGP